MPPIDPSLMSGFRDYLPKDMIPRQKMFDTIRSCFECFGFVPLDTPGLEREEVLTGGDPRSHSNVTRWARCGAGKRRKPDASTSLRSSMPISLARRA